MWCFADFIGNIVLDPLKFVKMAKIGKNCHFTIFELNFLALYEVPGMYQGVFHIKDIINDHYMTKTAKEFFLAEPPPCSHISDHCALYQDAQTSTMCTYSEKYI